MALVDGKWIASIFSYASDSGDGSTTAFVLPSTPHSNNAVIVFLNGLAQTPTVDYNISGDTVTFTTAPSLGQEILFWFVKENA